ncbi:MAG: cupin domain-containing protein [Herminiimonas sp.]|nr:cupin domain-containing protein [Herminiimonas sp.]
MNLEDRRKFEQQARAAGYDEVLERRWEENVTVALHSHPFDAHAVVVEGELWLTCDDQTRHLHSGDTFSLERGQMHSERYGTSGAMYLVARRNGTAP